MRLRNLGDRRPKRRHDRRGAPARSALVSCREQRLVEVIEVSIECLEMLVDPDPRRGILTVIKEQGEAQGVEMTATYDAVKALIAVLRAEIA